MDWFLYDIGLRHERVNQNVFHHLLLNKKSWYFSYKTASYLDIFWIAVGGGGFILAVSGWWWMVVGGGIVYPNPLVTNDHPVVAEFVRKELSHITITKSEEWKTNHVHESQSFLQIVKCTNTACSSRFQSSYLKIMKDRFLPTPLYVLFSSTRIEWAKDNKESTYLSIF